MQIPEQLFNDYYSACDDFIDLNFGINVTINYPAKRTDCPNCILDPLTKKSSNKYQSSGPIPFTNGNCPYCNGLGFLETVSTDTIKLRAYYDKKFWIKAPVPLNIPDNSVQVIGHISDMPKLQKCSSLFLHGEIRGYGNFEYILASEPVPHGFRRNKYFIAFLSRK